MSAQNVLKALKDTYGDEYFYPLVDDICKEYTDEELLADNAERQYLLNYTGFIPILIKAIQELDARVKELEGE